MGSAAPRVGPAPSDVAIVVPVGGAAPAWRECARSLGRLDPAPGQIVVVLDGPDAGHAAVAEDIDARLLVMEERGGPAKARNRGARDTTADILLFIDSDIEVSVDLVARVVEIFSDNHGTAAIMGSYDDAPGDPGFCSQYRNLLHHYVHQKGKESASTFWAGCGAIRRNVFLTEGGFDENFPVPSIEDIELGSRILRSGHDILLAKELQVKHLKKWSLGGMLTTDLLRRASPWTQLMLRQGQMVNDLNVKTRDRLSVVLAFVLVIAVVAAWWWPVAWVFAGAVVVTLAALNADLLGFFLGRRGVVFTLRAIPLYWMYLVVCGLGFGLGLGNHLFSRRKA